MSDPRDNLYTTSAMSGAFSADTHLKNMLLFEAALAHAEARAGVIPADAAEAIAAACDITKFDVGEIYREAAVAGTPAIPLVRMLTEQVADAGRDYVHWGATSQDAIDTALVLQMREGLALIEADLLTLCAGCADLAEKHRDTLMPGRTLLQQASPITFGLKAARWLGMVTRQVVELREQRKRALALQFGGAAGTLASLGDRGLDVAVLLAADLDLGLPDLPWHAERDRPASIAAMLGVTAGAMSKIATDITLLAQTEVGEVAEASAPGKGVSSAMPQKRNPVDATLALACVRLAIGQVPVILGAMSQEHERAIGGWQAEWAAIPSLFCYTGGAVAHVAQAVGGLEVDLERMAQNLQQSGGIFMAEALMTALAIQVGRSAAQQLVREVSLRARTGNIPLQQAAIANSHVASLLTLEEIARALDPACYLGSTNTFIACALASYKALSEQN